MANPNPGDAVVVIAPADLAVAQTGGWVSLKGAAGVTLTMNKGAGTAGQNPVLTFRQALNTAGGGAKNLNVTTIYTKAAGATGWTKTTQAAGATYTGVGATAGLYKFDISGASLDTANGFCAVSVNIASVGAGAQLGDVVGDLYGLRYGGALEDAPAPFLAEEEVPPPEDTLGRDAKPPEDEGERSRAKPPASHEEDEGERAHHTTKRR